MTRQSAKISKSYAKSSFVVVCSVLVLTACASTPTAEVAASEERAELAQAAKLSKVSDMFAHVNASEARDCMQYAMFKALAGDNILELSDTPKKASARDVKNVWQMVFNKKTEIEQQKAIETSQDRVKARQNGTREKLSEKKCLSPVVEKLEQSSLYEVSG